MPHLLDAASIILTPTAYEQDSLLAVKPVDGSGDMNYVRNGQATRVNSSGLIETVESNIPRIDYTGGTGVILVEPSSTNTATHSNDFSQGTNFNSGGRSLSSSVLEVNQGIAPDGTNTAQRLSDNNNGGTGAISLDSFGCGLSSGKDSTVSMFVKKDTVRYFVIKFLNFDTNQETSFDLDTGTVNRGTGIMTDYGNGWYRCSSTFSTTTDTIGALQFLITNSPSSTGGNSRDGSNSTLLWGYQAEESSFPTSYIPTSNGVASRAADVFNNSGNSSLMNSEEGVLYFEFRALDDSTIGREIQLSDGTINNRVSLFLGEASNRIRAQVQVGGSTVFNSFTTNFDVMNFNKMAIRYGAGSYAFYINGTLISRSNTQQNTFNPDTLDQLNLLRVGAGNSFQGELKATVVFPEALTDEELICLTS